VALAGQAHDHDVVADLDLGIELHHLVVVIRIQPCDAYRPIEASSLVP
jgi:hypothetical protein